jgi:hypothetical protein
MRTRASVKKSSLRAKDPPRRSSKSEGGWRKPAGPDRDHGQARASGRGSRIDIPLTTPEDTMTCDHETNAQELTPEQLELVAGGFSIQEMMASLKLMGEILSNVSKTRSEISMSFARNARA